MFFKLSVLVSAIARAVVVLIVIITINIKLRNFGVKIGYLLGVLGCKSDNLHPYRVVSIDKGLYLEANTTINR